MASKDLVVKLTINSSDFDNGLRNAKSSMNKFQKDTLSVSSVFKSAIGGMTKAFAGLGLAVGATEIFKSFINSTQTMSDAWGNAMVTAKTSFQVFETAVAAGTGGILNNFKQSIAAAREFAEAMDAFGSAQISNQYARMEFVTPFNEAMTRYREAKSSGNTTAMAFAASDMQRMLQAYGDNAQTLMTKSTEAVTAKLSSYTDGFINSGNMEKYVDQLYLEIINGVFPPILQDFNNLDTARRKGDYFYNQAKEEMEKNYGPGWRREAEAMKMLSEINDDTLKEMLGVLKTYDQVRNEINGMRRQMNRVVKGEGGGGTVTTPKLTGGGSSASTPTMTPDQIARYWFNDQTPGALVDIPLLDEEIFEPETEALMAKVAEQMKLIQDRTQYAATAMSAFGQAFGYAADLAGDNPFGNALQALSGVANAAVSTASSLMTLAGVETMEGVAEAFASAPPFSKLAMAGTALAGILSMMAAVKSSFAGSFANGGVVGGTSYSGDHLWARVNSGELIVPYNDWANTGQSNVHFIIEGSQLRGVLDNYDKTEAL